MTVYASWNGATEVASWNVLAGPDLAHLAPVTSAPKHGFETAIHATSNEPYFAVQALDANGSVLATLARHHPPFLSTRAVPLLLALLLALGARPDRGAAGRRDHDRARGRGRTSSSSSPTTSTSRRTTRAQFPALHDLMPTPGRDLLATSSSPTRSAARRAPSILRGQYVHNTGVMNNGGARRRLRGVRTQLGRRAARPSRPGCTPRGYRTALFGKYLNGYPDTVADALRAAGLGRLGQPERRATRTREYNYTLNENGTLVQYGHQPADYLVDVLARKTQRLHHASARASSRSSPTSRRTSPHEPATPAPRYADAFPGARAPRTAVLRPGRRPATSRAGSGDRPPLSPAVQRVHRRACTGGGSSRMLGVEDLLRDVVATLQQTGQLDNTYIVFTSDNGFHLGQHRLPPGKQTAYDEDIHVPLIVRGPGVPPARRSTQFACNVDLAPDVRRARRRQDAGVRRRALAGAVVARRPGAAGVAAGCVRRALRAVAAEPAAGDSSDHDHAASERVPPGLVDRTA